MKLTIAPQTLAEAVTWAVRHIPQRPAAKVLGGLLLEAGADGLALSSFDYEVSARAAIAADVAEPGRLLLPGRVLAEITKSLPKREFAEITSGDGESTLKWGSGEFGLATLPESDFPNLPKPPDALGSINGATFRAAVAQVVLAAGKDATLPMLTGVRVDALGSSLAMAATDRYRIAVRDLLWEPSQPGVADPVGVVVPAKALAELAKTFGDGPIHLGFADGLAGVTQGDRTTTIRLLDPQFIDYRARTGLDYPIWAELDPAPLIETVKRVTLVADDKARMVRLAFTQGGVLVRAGGGETGRGAETVPCDLEGDDVEIAFQSQLLLDGLAGVLDGRARIGMISGAKPALIVNEAGDNPAYRYLVMSLRLA